MSRLFRYAGQLCGLVLVLLAAGPARGQVRLLVLDTQSPFLAADQRKELDQALVGLAAEYSELELVETPDLETLRKTAGCGGLDAKCATTLGRAAGAQRVVSTQVQKLPGRQLLLMQLFDCATGRQLKQSRLRTRQGMPALHGSLTQAWQSLFGALIPMRLEISANVDEADLHLDGRPLGKSPLVLTRKLTAGPHVLSALRDDYQPAERRFLVKPGRGRLRHKFNLALMTSVDDIAPVALVPPPAGGKPGPAKQPADEPEPGAGKLKQGQDVEPVSAPRPAAALGAKLPDDKAAPGPSKLPTPAITAKPPAPSGDDSIAGPLLRKPRVEPAPASTAAPYMPGEPAPEPEPEPDRDRPIYKTWWFWTTIGAVAVAGVVTGTVLGLAEDEGIPSGRGRLNIHF